MAELLKENIDEIFFFCFLEHIEASAQPQLQEEGDFCGSVGRCEKPSFYLSLPFIVRIETIFFDILECLINV